MKLIINIPEVVKHKVYTYGLSLSPSDKEQLIKAVTNGIPIPNNVTNGNVIQALFPNIDKGFSNVIDLNLWWNALYKTESENKR